VSANRYIRFVEMGGFNPRDSASGGTPLPVVADLKIVRTSEAIEHILQHLRYATGQKLQR
jgi:hypothetical protein